MLTNNVKEYIEKNNELLDTDEGIQQLLDNYRNMPDAHDLFDVLRSIGLLQDYESLCDEYLKEVKKHVASSATGITVEPVFSPSIKGTSFPHNIEMFIDNNSQPPFEVPLSKSEKLIVDSSRMFIQRGNDRSAGISAGSTIIEYKLSLEELQHKNNIQSIIKDVNYYIEKFDSAFTDCLSSFKYKEDATKLINSLVPKVTDLMTSILGYNNVIVKDDTYWNRITITGKSKTGTIITLVEINYSSPITADEETLMSKAKVYLDSYKIQYDKNQARKAAKQAALAENPNAKIITRKEVTQAINASGVNVRTDFVYTNKHKTITTYKYAFNNLTQAECNKIKDELVKIGANVKNVTCEQGWWSGRGAYMSLFIRLYN